MAFGELETVIMDLLWARDDPATVRDLHTELASRRQIAYTTVMSTMNNLHHKGWLARSRTGLAYAYWPSMSREEHSAALMRAALESGGDADLVLSFFIDQMGAVESAKLREAVQRAAQRPAP